MKEIKKDNSGFTLVELIIAIVVIAIVMTPIYSNFREATIINGKAKAEMDATNMASNVMEGLSAYSAEEIIKAFYTKYELKDSAGNSLRTDNALSILPNEVTITGTYGDMKPSGDGSGCQGYVTNFTPSTFVDGEASYDYTGACYVTALNGGMQVSSREPENLKVVPMSDDKYVFYAAGLQQARGKYDVAIFMDASYNSGYSGDLNQDGSISGTETELYNDYESAKLTSVNPLFDGVYTENANDFDNACAYFVSKMTNNSKSVIASDFESQIKRTMSINITKDVNDYVYVDMETTYNLKDPNQFNVTSSGHQINVVNDMGGISEAPPSSQRIFDGSVYKQAPRNIYIYYMGNYKSTSSGVLDNFVIYNVANVPVDIHLIRIVTDEAKTTPSLEAGYRSTLKVNDAVAAGYHNTRIYSNLKDDLTATDLANETNRLNMNRCTFNINGSQIWQSDNAEYLEIVSENGGVKTEVENRLYSVVMYVYEDGAAALGFPEDMLITTFDGSSTQ